MFAFFFFFFTIDIPPKERVPLMTVVQPVSAIRGVNKLSGLSDAVDDDDDEGERVTGTWVGFFIRCTVTFKHGQGR